MSWCASGDALTLSSRAQRGICTSPSRLTKHHKTGKATGRNLRTLRHRRALHSVRLGMREPMRRSALGAPDCTDSTDDTEKERQRLSRKGRSRSFAVLCAVCEICAFCDLPVRMPWGLVRRPTRHASLTSTQRAPASAVTTVPLGARFHCLYQLIMYSCVRMKLDGLDPVPWNSPSKRSSADGTPRILSAA